MKTCFIISPIGDAQSETRKRSDQILKYVIRPALDACGYQAVRADEISVPGMITNQIIARLLSAELAIADLTGGNPNVFYELGIRHALNKPVIQIIGERERLPFDVSQFRTLFIDHRDIDSVFNAKDTLKRYIKGLENDPSLYDSPVSSVSRVISEKSPRHIPVSAYLKEISPDQIQNVSKAVKLLAGAFGLSIEKEGPDESGSWFKIWITKTQELLSEPEVKERMRKMELAIETEVLKKRQAEVDKSQAEAVSALISALADTENAVLQLGSILLVKRTDKDGTPAIAVRNLTSREIMLLEKQPSLLRDPVGILKQLDDAGDTEQLTAPDEQ